MSRLVTGPRAWVRGFATSAVAQRLHAHVVRRRIKKIEAPKAGDPNVPAVRRLVNAMPPYPYGDATLYKQSNRGLYGGRMIQFGNKVSDFGNRNMRTFEPNVQWSKLWSEALNRQINIRVVAKVLKTITKEGGLDNYLIKDKPARVKELGPTGWKLRFEVLQKLEAQDKTSPRPISYISSTGETSVEDFQALEYAGEAPAEHYPVYARYSLNGVEHAVVYGRTKLLRTLFHHLKEQESPEAVTYRHFLSLHRDFSIDETLKKLDEAGYDVSQVSFGKASLEPSTE